MQFLKQIFIIFFICFVSRIISFLLPVTFSSNVIGMVLLYILLWAKIIRPESIGDFSEFLLKNMAFFFIPAGVAIMDNVSFLAGRIPLVLFIVVLTLVITFGISTLTATLTMNLIKKRKDRYHD